MISIIVETIAICLEFVFATILIWGLEARRPKRFKSYTIGFILIAAIGTETFNLLQVNQAWNNVVSVFVIVYIMALYKEKLMNSVLIFAMATVVAMVSQLALLAPLSVIQGGVEYYVIISILINIMCVGIGWLLVREFGINKWMDWLRDRDASRLVAILIWLVGLFYYATKFKWHGGSISYLDFLIILIFSMTSAYMAIHWQKALTDKKMALHELEMKAMYDEAFQGLIDDIRMKQHNFREQLTALISLRYRIKDYDALVSEQEKACGRIVKENRYYNLLCLPDYTLSGFLYSKFLEADELGVSIEHDVIMSGENAKLSIFEMVNIIGILLNNAYEAAIKMERPRVVFNLFDYDGSFRLIVRNVYMRIPVNEMQNLGKKGYTTKRDEGGQGLGVYHVQSITNKNGGTLKIKNESIDGDDWLHVEVKI